jgi:hypothetical protein
MRVLGAEPGCFVPVVSCFFIVGIGVVDRDDVHACMLRQLPVFLCMLRQLPVGQV